MQLSKAVDIIPGHPFRGSIPECVGGGVRVVQPKDVSAEGGVVWSRTLEVEVSGRKQPDWLAAGDVLFAAKGNQNYAVLVDAVPGPAVSSPYFYILRPKRQNLLPAFLVWWLNQLPARRHYERGSEGSLVKSLRRSELEQTPLVVPPLEQQQHILRLQQAQQREAALLKQLIRSGEQVMTSLAASLHKNATQP